MQHENQRIESVSRFSCESAKLLDLLVDLIGIEPMTSSMPWKRAPSCATGPLLGRTSSILVDARQQVNGSGGTNACVTVSKSIRAGN
jgi:hypothetical protein